MKKYILIMSILCIGFSITVPPQGKIEDTSYLELAKSKFATFIVSFAAMSNRLERPLGTINELSLVDLDYAITDMYEDLKEVMAEVEQDYFQRSAAHKKIIDELTVDLGNAQIEIGNSLNLVDNILKGELNQLNKKMVQLKDFLTQNKNAVGREDAIQKDMQKLYQEKVQNHQVALKTLDIALDVVQKLISGELDINDRGALQRQAQEMTGCLNKKYENYPLVSALIESIPTFENLKQLKKMRYKLTRIRQSVQEQFNEDIFHDRTQTTLYQKRVQQLEKELQIFQTQITDNTSSINNIQQKIAYEEEFQDLRRSDVQMYANQKQMENDAYAYEISIFLDLKNQYALEFELAEKALSLVKSRQFADLVRNNIDIKLKHAQNQS